MICRKVTDLIEGVSFEFVANIFFPSVVEGTTAFKDDVLLVPIRAMLLGLVMSYSERPTDGLFNSMKDFPPASGAIKIVFSVAPFTSKLCGYLSLMYDALNLSAAPPTPLTLILTLREPSGAISVHSMGSINLNDSYPLNSTVRNNLLLCPTRTSPRCGMGPRPTINTSISGFPTACTAFVTLPMV